MAFDDSIKQENLEAFEKLLGEKDQLDKNDLTRYRFYRDLYGIEYRWYTHKQEDDKFKAEIVKVKHKRGWASSWTNKTVVKTRSFAKKKSATKWLVQKYRKAHQHQKLVLDARAKRKQEKLAAKPILTKEQIVISQAEKKIKHYESLQAKADKKIKALNTRKKNYNKKIKYYRKRIEAMK